MLILMTLGIQGAYFCADFLPNSITILQKLAKIEIVYDKMRIVFLEREGKL